MAEQDMAEQMWTRRGFFRQSAAALALGAPILLGACSRTPQAGGAGALDSAKKAGTIKIGIAGEQPYGFTDKNGNVTGEAPEVARAIFKNLGIANVQATQVEFNQLIPALNARQFDLVAAGMDITPTRCKNATFSVPDYSALPAFLVAKGNPKGVQTFDDVKATGAKLAVLSGAVEKDFATQAGIAAGQLQSYDTQNALLQAVTSNRVDCAVLTDISFKTVVQQNPSAPVEVTPGFTPVINGKKGVETGGFVFRNDESDLVAAFNTELRKLHDSGEWVRIVHAFGFSQDNVPTPDVTTESLCAAS